VGPGPRRTSSRSASARGNRGDHLPPQGQAVLPLRLSDEGHSLPRLDPLRVKRDAERYERDLRTEIASGRREKPTITLDDGAGLYWDDKGQFEANGATTEYQLGNLVRLIGGRCWSMTLTT
jgi:hypothetical protein